VQPSVIVKYDFRIRTRNGALVENVSIHGRDAGDAERKLRQMYNGCEVLEQRQHQAAVGPRVGAASFEDVVDLITLG